MSKNFSKKKFDGSSLRIVVVAARFNEDICEGLLKGALLALQECKVPREHITVIRVPGSFELPLAVARALDDVDIDAAVALSVLIKGETKHDEFLANAVTSALQDIAVRLEKPVGYGVITAITQEQALERAQENQDNRGYHAAYAAVEMALLR